MSGILSQGTRKMLYYTKLLLKKNLLPCSTKALRPFLGMKYDLNVKLFVSDSCCLLIHGISGYTVFTYPEDAHPVLPTRNYVVCESIITDYISSRNIKLLHIVKDDLGEVAVV